MGRKMTTRLCVRCSSTASRPAASAMTLLPVPAGPPMDTMPTRGSARRSMAIRCSAERPCKSNSVRSPRTRWMRLSSCTRPSADCDPAGLALVREVLGHREDAMVVVVRRQCGGQACGVLMVELDPQRAAGAVRHQRLGQRTGLEAELLEESQGLACCPTELGVVTFGFEL